MTYLSVVLSGIGTPIGAYGSICSPHKHLRAQECSLNLGCATRLQSPLWLLVPAASNLQKTSVYNSGQPHVQGTGRVTHLPRTLAGAFSSNRRTI